VAQIADGKGRAAEGGRERGELQPGPGPLDGVLQDPRVIESQPAAYLRDRHPAGGPGVRTSRRNRKVRRDGEVRHADDPAPRVAIGSAIGGHLLKVQGRAVEPGLLA
jgi:hypothetical protein